MKNSLLALVALAVAHLASAFASAQDHYKDDGPLKAELARQALIELAESSKDEAVRFSLSELTNGKFVSVGDNEIMIGKWYCNLAKKSFVLSLSSDTSFFEISGVFEQSKEQKWHAKVTGKRQT